MPSAPIQGARRAHELDVAETKAVIAVSGAKRGPDGQEKAGAEQRAEQCGRRRHRAEHDAAEESGREDQDVDGIGDDHEPEIDARGVGGQEHQGADGHEMRSAERQHGASPAPVTAPLSARRALSRHSRMKRPSGSVENSTTASRAALAPDAVRASLAMTKTRPGASATK